MELTKENIQDIYPLSPMQEGMYFQWQLNPSSIANFNQHCFRIQRKFNVEYVEKSLNELLKRHDILRTVYSQKVSSRVLQIVLKKRVFDFHFEDISLRNDKEEYLKKIKEGDKKRRFDLAKDIMTRVILVQLEENVFEIIWSNHHILMDGWCIRILIKEFFEIYRSFIEKRPFRLPPAIPFGYYIEWIEKQDKNKLKAYWRQYLNGFDEPTQFPKKQNLGSNLGSGVKEYKKDDVYFLLDHQEHLQLKQISTKYQVTANVILQSCWAILLGKYNNKKDILFGAVVSGRPSEIEDVETMIGLFINTIPVRIFLTEDLKFVDLIKRVQERALQSEVYHYLPLSEIQNLNPLKHKLFDHLMVFENYPKKINTDDSKQAVNEKNEWQGLISAETLEHTSYDLFVQVFINGSMAVKIVYNENIYDQSRIKKISSRFQSIIRQVLVDADMDLKKIQIATDLLATETTVHDEGDFDF